MPDEQSAPRFQKQTTVPQHPGTEMSVIIPRLSLKVGSAVFLLAGLFLLLVSQDHFLLVHTIIEVSSIILLAAVFLIGWNTRHLVHNQFFVILSSGFLLTAMVDLLHTLAYKGMQILPVAGADEATQLWLIARAIAVSALLVATFSLGRKEICSARAWLLSFVLCGGLLVALVWPLGVFPVCYVEGEGLTAFKVNFEYTIIGLLSLSAVFLYKRREYLNQQLITWLLISIGLSVVSALLFTLYKDVYGFFNFLGHYFKLGSVVLVYFALVEATIRAPFATLFREMGQSYEDLNLELQKRRVAEEKQAIASRETTILYQMSRVMHRTLNLDELAHLTLSAATSAGAGSFERATLFTVNRRTGMLQGMLGVSQELSTLVLSAVGEQLSWDSPSLDEASCEAQRRTPYNQKVVKQRLSLDGEDNALARAFLERRVVLVSHPDKEPAGGRQLSGELDLGPYACAPMTGRNQVMGVLLVDNYLSREEISPQRRRFLELFASQAGSALDNASLVKRLEMAHDNLRDVQEQLIQGEKMAVLGEMAAQVAHELRNPLVSIGGFAQRLSREDLKDAKANEYAGIIAREVRRMEDMLGNILSFSKKQMVCLENCSVADVLQEVIALEYDHFQKQRIEIDCRLEKDLPVIAGDYRQLRQVFLNLLINARQVIGDNGLVRISARSGLLRGELAVVVEMEDTGGGISPEVMRNMFNPFFSTFAKGTGLGLSISHRIIDHHHGQIEVMNVDGGARFIVSLPVVQPKTLDMNRSENDATG